MRFFVSLARGRVRVAFRVSGIRKGSVVTVRAVASEVLVARAKASVPMA